MKIIAIHGVGRHERGGEWEASWKEAIEASLSRTDSRCAPDIKFVSYDSLFDAHAITTSGTAEAIAKLVGSWAWHSIGDAATSLLGRRHRGTARGVGDSLRWTAGMVVQWIENDDLRATARTMLLREIEQHDPKVVLAHSLGSLIAYDAFFDPAKEAPMAGRVFVSFGSQIGSPAVRAEFGGRIVPFACEHWYHLYNREDAIFTAPLSIQSPTFEQVDCYFDICGVTDHDATRYLSHSSMSDVVWSDVLSNDPAQDGEILSDNPTIISARQARRDLRHGHPHEFRALLVGIDEYPDPSMRLEGCANDVFLMSAMLQERGFDASDIRLLLNRRATADEIRDRIEWLLAGVRPNEKRVLYFSGHGAQIPDYGADESVDKLDECLVPWDFDWSHISAVTDDWFHEIYSQLDYEVQFAAIMDCCHSGGMTRAGLGRPRGLEPPDDIRHRNLMWNHREHRWEPRKFRKQDGAVSHVQESWPHRSLGGALDLVTLDMGTFRDRREQFRHHGPYLPAIIQACQEWELAFEYRQGNTVYGAFTYNLVEELRDIRTDEPSLRKVVENVGRRLASLGYNQVPKIVGPEALEHFPSHLTRTKEKR